MSLTPFPGRVLTEIEVVTEGSPREELGDKRVDTLSLCRGRVEVDDTSSLHVQDPGRQ